MQATKAHTIKVKLERKVLYELDGGDRKKVKSFKVKVEPGASPCAFPRRRIAPMTQIEPTPRPPGSARRRAKGSSQPTAFECSPAPGSSPGR